jgi:hypothetical protein
LWYIERGAEVQTKGLLFSNLVPPPLCGEGYLKDFFTADHELALPTGMKMGELVVGSCLPSGHFEVGEDWSV